MALCVTFPGISVFIRRLNSSSIISCVLHSRRSNKCAISLGIKRQQKVFTFLSTKFAVMGLYLSFQLSSPIHIPCYPQPVHSHSKLQIVLSNVSPSVAETDLGDIRLIDSPPFTNTSTLNMTCEKLPTLVCLIIYLEW